MSGVIVAKDLLLLRREPVVFGVLLVFLGLVFISLLAGAQRESVFDKERTAALETDRAVWMNQGDRNPHSAAHFSRYAFRPASPLAALDPGVEDFSGLAIWMEAHYQDPAVFRRAEDGGELSRYAQLSPAVLVLIIAPLLVFLLLFGSVAGEREDGTLRQLLATGVHVRQIFIGKFGAGLRITLLVFTAIFVLAGLVSVTLSSASIGVDTAWRLGSLYVAYTAYLVTCVAIAIGVSALSRTRQSAFVALAVVWAMMTIVVPRLATDVSTTLVPQPDSRSASAELSAASNTYYGDKARQKRIEEEVLQRYGVESIEDLPINYGAYVLQVSEELSEPEFDRFYAQLDDRYARQEKVLRAFALATPTIAVTRLSRAFAGTDREHQRAFAKAAEAHRREMIQMLNEDYMYNAANDGSYYTSDEALWQQFEDLGYQVPALVAFAGAYRFEGLLLLAWLLVAVVFSYRSVVRAARREVPVA